MPASSMKILPIGCEVGILLAWGYEQAKLKVISVPFTAHQVIQYVANMFIATSTHTEKETHTRIYILLCLYVANNSSVAFHSYKFNQVGV